MGKEGGGGGADVFFFDIESKSEKKFFWEGVQ